MLEAFQSSLALAYCSAASSLVITSPSLTASHGCDCHLRSKTLGVSESYCFFRFFEFWTFLAAFIFSSRNASRSPLS